MIRRAEGTGNRYKCPAAGTLEHSGTIKGTRKAKDNMSSDISEALLCQLHIHSINKATQVN